MRKLYYVRQFATGQSAFIVANNKSQVVELMNHNGLCGKGDRIELIGHAYGHTLKKLTKPTMFDWYNLASIEHCKFDLAVI